MMPAAGDLVYIVDDDEAVRDSVHLLLQSHGIAVEVFASAAQFLAAFNSARAACLVLDLHMPEMGGLELLVYLQSRHVRCPTIVVSGRRDAALDAALRQAGATAILSKPAGDDELLALIRKAITDDAD